MPLDLLTTTPSQLDLDSISEELQDSVFRGVDGFLQKYFEDQAFSISVKERIHQAESSGIAGDLAADILKLWNQDDSEKWLMKLQTLLTDRKDYSFVSQSFDETEHFQGTVVHLKKPSRDATADLVCMFGEYHGGEGDIDDKNFLCLSWRARYIFNMSPTRRFLHAFLVQGTVMELFVFDRSGVCSSRKLDLTQKPIILLQVMLSYAMMTEDQLGFNPFVKCLEAESGSYVTFNEPDRMYILPQIIAAPNYLIGLGTTCYPVSTIIDGSPDAIIKFSWRVSEEHSEVETLKEISKFKVLGTLQLLAGQDISSVAVLRDGLHLTRPFVQRTLSCIMTAPIGRPIQQFSSFQDLMEGLHDLVRALQSLYIEANMIHRDIAIKNVVLGPKHKVDGPKGILIDFDMALKLKTAKTQEPLVGSDGFMAIGILLGSQHTYRHDLESLFYVFLWLAIGNNREYADANDILKTLPTSSRLHKWCSMDFRAVGLAKREDMSPEGFSGILSEFSTEFVPLENLARKLHGLIFPVRDGKIFTGTDTDPATVVQLYNGVAEAFSQQALAFKL